jgi:hypothetical protein
MSHCVVQEEEFDYESERAKKLQLIPFPKKSVPIIPKKYIAPIVIHLKTKQITLCDIYIGKAITTKDLTLPRSKWCNPFTVAKYQDLTLSLYEDYLRKSPELLGALSELSGKTLGCRCSEEKCHGDVLVRLFTEFVMKS